MMKAETATGEGMAEGGTASGERGGVELSEPQALAVAALMRGARQKQVAAEAGVCERTIRNWLKQPEFKDAVRAAQTGFMRETVWLLQAGAREAIRTLRAVMNDPEATQPARVSAARAMLELGVRTAEVYDQAERMRELEVKLAALERGPVPGLRQVDG